MADFTGKVAMVTGAATGIGEAIARSLATAGATVAIADIDAAAARSTAAAIGGTEKAVGIACDVADPVSVEAAVAEVRAGLGGIDVLVNNAGLHLTGYVRPVSELPVEDWRRLLDVNVLGVVHCAKACRETMRARGGGAIVNIASMAAYKGENAYGISKLAVRGLTVALARDFAADGIRVCGVAPGFVASEAAMRLFPEERRDHYVNEVQLVRRLGQVDDVARAVRFLLSEDASFITAETILVSGGALTRI
ncbi:SDR family NAD(P)-dependent oxidoreductase [Rhizorhabdus histidinilytica]|uniref:NADP-dependent 3-hydroxy acid dehydrogenase YdfG n=1 Tax=Rhizorhabdus histidinilytica TaxID=439228 RepID=A0A1T5EMX0_9SPHN|nr:SDR family oxidoreductase [Rhizorhabdus histidinilytica]SKB85169.1 NADP-dependent 3-hydroxy acid dehydrogenase YdfG [Rhizorhabdus histidinilytica]